jgi:hypothetical protein
MKMKTKQVTDFLEGLHKYIINDYQFRKDASIKSESEMQTEIRPIIMNYLRRYFEDRGYKDAEGKANASFYWEGQEGVYGKRRKLTFGARNYPDFIVMKPYLTAIEYKKGDSGSVVKQGIGQSIMHTLSGDFDYVYYLFQDTNKDERIRNSRENSIEETIINMMWNRFNVFIKIIGESDCRPPK